MPSLPYPSPPAAAPRPALAVPLLLLAAFTAAAIATGAAAYRIGRSDLRIRRAGELAGIAVQKGDQVARWRDERIADALQLAHDPALAAARSGAAAGAALTDRLERTRDIGDYTAIALVDAVGALRAASGAVMSDPPAVGELLALATARGLPVMSDVHADSDGSVHVDVIAPIPPRHPESPAGVLLRIDPRPTLFRLVEFWHEPGVSAQALLVRSEGPRPAVLNGAPPVRGGPRALPLSDPALAGLRARRFGTFRARDAAGAAVIGASTPIPGTPWSLLVREDEEETLAPLQERAVTIGATVLALVVAAAAGVAVWISRQARRLEQARAVSEAQREALVGRLDRLATNVQDMVIVADDEQRIVEVNASAVHLLGWAREELLGMPIRALRDPATLDDYEDRLRQQAEHGAALFETRYRRKDGTTFPVQVSVHTETYGGRDYFEAIVRDRSDVKRAEQALRDSEAKFRTAFEHSILGVALVGPDRRIVEANRALQEMTGYSVAELRAMPSDALDGSRGENPAAEPPYAAFVRGEVAQADFPLRLRRKDGALRDVTVRASTLPADPGAPPLVIALVEDVSDKKRMEAQLLLADRMASVGTLAAGVAHEINNPLAFILSNLEFALAELRRDGADEEVLRALEEAKAGGARVREIVRDLNTFSRPAGEVRHPVDVRGALRSAVGLAGAEIRGRARLVVAEGEAPPVLADEHRLVQVFVNLLLNAAQAIAPGDVAANEVRATTSTAADGGAIVEIADTGHGIAEELLPRIFDPFFTTKPVGVGTGLGLSICHGIVSSLGGGITVESAAGKGTTFRVHLPPAWRAAAEVRLPSAPPSSPRDEARRPRVLVVDDEPLVASAVSRTLAATHDVVAVTSGRDALARLSNGGERWDAVICDLLMPEMTGMELFDRLLAVSPALAARTVFLTGGAFTGKVSAFLERVPNARLEKPFEPRALRELLARVLAPTPPGASRAG